MRQGHDEAPFGVRRDARQVEVDGLVELAVRADPDAVFLNVVEAPIAQTARAVRDGKGEGAELFVEALDAVRAAAGLKKPRGRFQALLPQQRAVDEHLQPAPLEKPLGRFEPGVQLQQRLARLGLQRDLAGTAERDLQGRGGGRGTGEEAQADEERRGRQRSCGSMSSEHAGSSAEVD
ncbi:MAG: hypothetical protein M5U26_16135 [Planctomycetota bacterium]|nr:hypothetical protein [Planctomycetota bacterium]